jgi:hypothetical protein
MIDNNRRFVCIIGFIFTLCIFLLVKRATAQIEVEEEPKRLYYERTRRITNFWEMKDFRDVTHKDKLLMGKNRISGNISFNTGRVIVNDGEKEIAETRYALGYFLRVRFFEQFSANATIYQDFNPRASAKWTSNYTYGIGRYNWKPNRFNFGYENYINNRYTDTKDQFWENFLEGYYFLSYNDNWDSFVNAAKIDESTAFRIVYFSRYSIHYKDVNNERLGSPIGGKLILGGGFRYTIFRNIYVESALYYYPEAVKQMPWDPDYSYGFGYFDWRSFRLSFTYGNWAVNRFPWKETAYPHYGFLDGNFRLAANWIW